MKRKRLDSTTISNKILCLQNGSNVEAQLNDGKWHSGIIIQCQSPRKYLVQVEQQQYWIESDLIRPNTIIDQKRNVPFEYRPGQFLRNETKSKIGVDEKVSSPPLDSVQIESSNELKKKRLPITTSEQKKSPFVWKPSTSTTIQTRRSSKNGHSPSISSEENPFPIDNHYRTRTLSNSTQPKPIIASNSVKTSSETPSSEVLIFRPIIRFVDSATNGHSSTEDPIDDELAIKSSEPQDEYRSTTTTTTTTTTRNSKDDDYPESLTTNDLIYHINASTDSRSSSTTSTDNPYLVNHYDSIPTAIEHQIKTEHKSSCFLETPPPSLPDIHITQESESPLERPLQQFKSKRKQDRPQRKQIQTIFLKEQGEQINGVLDRLLLKQTDDKTSTDFCDPGYLSDEYSEPITSTNDVLTYLDLEKFYHSLENIDEKLFDSSLNLSEEEKIVHEELITYLYNNNENYEKLTKYSLEYYTNKNNQRLQLILNILQRIFSLYFNQQLIHLFHWIPNEIKIHMKLCLKNVKEKNLQKNKILTRGKRGTHCNSKHRSVKIKKSFESTTTTMNLGINNDEQQMLLSPSSPLTPVSAKVHGEDLLSPNNKNNNNLIEQIAVLPKERDIYEVIHCLCNCEIDNGFMIQCETCLCWSHCECVGVTATCIPAFFKCNVCTKAEADRTSQGSLSSIFDDETTTTLINSEKISLFLSYSRRLWNLREQIAELKLRYTPILRSLQHALRCDDLVELFNYANIKSDELRTKIEERQINRPYFECIALTIDHMVDSVCSSISTSSCLSIELITKTEVKTNSLNDQMNVLICHLCDDEDTRQVRLSIQNRYEKLMSTVDNKIQTILLEHQNIQTQMELELGIVPNNLSDDYLSYDAHELAIRTAIERLKC